MDADGNTKESVSLMTIHQAKGLEVLSSSFIDLFMFSHCSYLFCSGQLCLLYN